jgi:hypothetical protein
MKSRRNDLGRACGTYGRDENVYGILVRKAEEGHHQEGLGLNDVYPTPPQ